jgi:hypothetical protein
MGPVAGAAALVAAGGGIGKSGRLALPHGIIEALLPHQMLVSCHARQPQPSLSTMISSA